MYSIVEFEDGSCDMAPSAWIHGESCLWPPSTTKSHDSKFNQTSGSPGPDWIYYNVRILSHTGLHFYL